jgi:hypothetical protein
MTCRSKIGAVIMFELAGFEMLRRRKRRWQG